MGLTRKKNKFLTSLTQNVGYKNKSKKKNKEGMVGGAPEHVIDYNRLLTRYNLTLEKATKNLQSAKSKLKKAEDDALVKPGPITNAAVAREKLWVRDKEADAARAKKNVDRVAGLLAEAATDPDVIARKKFEDAMEAKAKAAAKAAKANAAAMLLRKAEKITKQLAEAEAAAKAADKAAADKAAADKAAAEKEAAKKEEAKKEEDAMDEELLAEVEEEEEEEEDADKAEAAKEKPAFRDRLKDVDIQGIKSNNIPVDAALIATLAAAVDDSSRKTNVYAGKTVKTVKDGKDGKSTDTDLASSDTTIEASIANTKQALLNSIDLCIAVQKSTVEDKNVIDNKIIVAINDTINSENYNFSKNTLKKAIEALSSSSIIKNHVTYSRVDLIADNFKSIKKRKRAVETAGTEAKKVLEEDDKLQTLVTSIVAILPYYVIDKKNAFSIIAILTILAANGYIKFAISIPLTFPALNSFMAALNAFQASLELEAINEKLKKQTGGTGDDAFMTGGDKLKIAVRSTAKLAAAAAVAVAAAAAGMEAAAARARASAAPGPLTKETNKYMDYSNKTAANIAKVKAANNLALKAEDYFNTCVDLEEEAAKSGTKDIEENAYTARVLAQEYYLTAKKMAEKVTIDVLKSDADVKLEDLGMLTNDNIAQQTEKREAIDQDVKKIMNGLSSIEDKTRGLMDMLNELLESKRDIYNPLNIDATVVNAKATEEQAHIESINKIMNYLNEKNIDLKYYWAQIVTSKYDEEKLRGKVGIINEITETTKTENTENADVKGLWNVKLWIPDTKGEYIFSPYGAVSRYMKVITKDNKTIDTFIQQNSVSIYSVRFLKDIKYDPNLSNNRQPHVRNANTRTLGKFTSGNRRYRSRVNAITNVSGLTRDAIDNAADFSSRLNKRTLGIGEFKSKYKNEIAKILDHEITDANKRNLLKQVIVYDNKKKSIRDILASNISSIFAKGETSLNVYRQQNLRKNFKKKKPDPEDEEEGDKEEVDDEEEDVEEGEDGKKANLKGGALQEEEEQIGGLGSYGFRNFDREDASKFIDFILESLLELKTELEAFDKDQEDKLEDKLTNTQALLIEKYLISLFEQIGPSGLNKLLPQISNTITVSKLVIKHFIKRLKRRQEGKEGEEDKEDKEGTEDKTPAKQISELNFSLKHNAGSFASAIIDITLNSEELQGTEDEIENDLNKKYDKAMKIPFEAEKSRIANSQIRQVFIDVFGDKLTTINEYRKRIKEMDDLIDTITNTNIKQKLKNIESKLGIATITNGVITYRLPTNLKEALNSIPATETTEEQLEKAMALIKDLKSATTDAEKLAKLNSLTATSL